ncbi:cip1-interacting zinc finger protein isoform X1 [Dipodomys merriami]|uniref:cip1-interacting zinc finger protein isoform X1 n=1 Tax=Dipodomys merriami TaxID=94247 RepID=UPI00384FD2E4
MFNQQQLQQQQQQQQQLQQQQQQLLQLQQLLQQSQLQAPLSMTVNRGLLQQQQSQQQPLNLQGAPATPLLNSSMLQRAFLLQQLQGLDQFGMPPATYDSTGLTMPMATLGSLRGYGMAAPNLAAPSLTAPPLAPPNLLQFFPQATRQSLLGPPPAGVPMNPSQLSLSGRNPQRKARNSSSIPPNRKTAPLEDRKDPLEGCEEDPELSTDTLEDQDSPTHPDGTTSERRPLAVDPAPHEDSDPPAKRLKSSEEFTKKRPPGQLQAKVQPQARTTAPKQTQTSEPLGTQVLPRIQPWVLQTQVQPQTQPPADTQVRPKLQKQAQTQTSPEHLLPEPEQVQPQVQVHTQEQARNQPQEQPAEQVSEPPPEQTQDETEDQPQEPVSIPEQAPDLAHDAIVEALASTAEAGGGGTLVISGMEEAWPESVCAQVSEDVTQEEPPSGLDVGECEKRAKEMLGMWGAGSSLKVTILQSSNSRAFSTVPVTSGPRPGDSSSATPTGSNVPSRPALQFFCYICKASCNSQQEFQDHMLEAQHQQRLGEMEHASQSCLLSLLPMPRDVLEREAEEPPPKRWCNTCQVYYMGDLIQHRRTQDHKIAKQSLRPFCTVCNRYFKTPRKFVEHVKSQEHKDKAEELKTLEKERASPDEEHFITVDAVGCFEGDEEDEKDEEEIEVEEEVLKQVSSGDLSVEEWKNAETCDPDTAYGVDLLVPVMGYVCRICRKFYHSTSGVQPSHCKTQAHIENLQKHKAAKKPSPTVHRPVSRRCAINARNALTALFTSSSSSGRLPTHLSSHDRAKAPNKVKRQPLNLLPPRRRSTRLKT